MPVARRLKFNVLPLLLVCSAGIGASHTIATENGIAAPMPKLDACALLTAAEVANIVGGKVGDGVPNDSGTINDGAYSATCVWKLPTAGNVEIDPDVPLKNVSFAMLNAISWPAGSAGAKDYLESFRNAAHDKIIPADPVALKQLGDEALWWGDGVAVRKGNISYGISVRIVNGTPANVRAMAEALARKIVGRV
jgi:hypothetical protein